MESQYWPLIRTAYNGFNDRNIDAVFAVMTADVHWPKAFEGGYVIGYDAIREYWTRQWSEINPKVIPISIIEIANGKIEVLIDQLVKDLDGNIVFKGKTKHIYTLHKGLIAAMDIGEIE